MEPQNIRDTLIVKTATGAHVSSTQSCQRTQDAVIIKPCSRKTHCWSKRDKTLRTCHEYYKDLKITLTEGHSLTCKKTHWIGWQSAANQHDTQGGSERWLQVSFCSSHGCMCVYRFRVSTHTSPRHCHFILSSCMLGLRHSVFHLPTSLKVWTVYW